MQPCQPVFLVAECCWHESEMHVLLFVWVFRIVQHSSACHVGYTQHSRCRFWSCEPSCSSSRTWYVRHSCANRPADHLHQSSGLQTHKSLYAPSMCEKCFAGCQHSCHQRPDRHACPHSAGAARVPDGKLPAQQSAPAPHGLSGRTALPGPPPTHSMSEAPCMPAIQQHAKPEMQVSRSTAHSPLPAHVIPGAPAASRCIVWLHPLAVLSMSRSQQCTVECPLYARPPFHHSGLHSACLLGLAMHWH